MNNIEQRRRERLDGFFVKVTRLIADKIADFLHRKQLLTPNKVSFLSLLFVIVSGIFASQGEYHHLIVSAFLFYVGFIFDCVDGELARLDGTDSIGGQWLDVTLGELGNVIFQIGCGIGLYSQTGELESIWILVLFLLSKYLYGNIMLNSQVQLDGYANFKKLALDPLSKNLSFIFVYLVRFKAFIFKRVLSVSNNGEYNYEKKIPSIGVFIIVPILLLLFNQLFLLLWFYILFYSVSYFIILLQILYSCNNEDNY